MFATDYQQRPKTRTFLENKKTPDTIPKSKKRTCPGKPGYLVTITNSYILKSL